MKNYGVRLNLLTITEENQESTNDARGKCTGAKLITSTLCTSAYGLTNNGGYLGTVNKEFPFLD